MIDAIQRDYRSQMALEPGFRRYKELARDLINTERLKIKPFD